MKIVEQTRKSNKFYRSLAEQDLYPMLLEMGNTKQRIDQFQKQRLGQSVLVAVIMVIFGLFLSKWFYMGALVGSVLFYKSKHSKIRSQYTTWKFQRHLQFSKFTRLLIPYLKQSKGQVALYTIFNKILQRMEDEADRTSLYKLMSEMSNNPSDIQPFIAYAERASGTDMSVLFMSTIFDFQQTTFDTSVIDELGKIASEELMTSIDEIINFKLRRFVFFPTKVVMTSFIMVLGFAVAVLVANLSTIQL